MPRGNRYYQPGLTYHLTHRCHDRQFLLRYALDRDAYRLALWEVLRSSSVWLLAHSITSNHAHLLARSDASGAGGGRRHSLWRRGSDVTPVGVMTDHA